MTKKRNDQPESTAATATTMLTGLQYFAVTANLGSSQDVCSKEYVLAADAKQALLLYLKWFPMRTKLDLTLDSISVSGKQLPADTKVICTEEIKDTNKDGEPATRTILQRKRMST